MYAFRQIIEDPQDVVAVPPELRHRRTEVIFIAIDQQPDVPETLPVKASLVSLAGCWKGEALVRAPQGEYEIRRELD